MGVGRLRVATEYNIYKSIETLNVHIEFKMLKFKVPIVFLSKSRYCIYLPYVYVLLIGLPVSRSSVTICCISSSIAVLESLSRQKMTASPTLKAMSLHSPAAEAGAPRK